MGVEIRTLVYNVLGYNGSLALVEIPPLMVCDGKAESEELHSGKMGSLLPVSGPVETFQCCQQISPVSTQLVGRRW